VNQVAYPDLFGKYTAALAGTGELPDLAQMEDISVQELVDSESTVPAEACVEADGYDLSDYLPRTLEFYSTEGVLRAMPWNVSNVVLIYNKSAFERAGLDPERPPTTLEELEEYSQQIVDTGAAPNAMALHVEPYTIEYLYATSGEEFVNNGNGRDERATETQIDSAVGAEIWSWWNDMVSSGLAINTGSQSNNYDHLFALGNQQVAMTFEASGVLGSVEAVLASGEFGGVEIGVGALPGVEAEGSVPVGDGSLWIPRASSPAKKAAAWEFIKFLNEPAQQAALSVGSQGGYVPVRRSAVEEPALQSLWEQKSWPSLLFDQLDSGPITPASIGPVMGDYQGVRNALRDGFVRMLVGDASPDDAMATTQAEATELIRNYNDRIGG